MESRTIRVDLGYKAFSGCRRRPAVVLLDAAMRVGPGGVLEVRGNRGILSLEAVLDTLQSLGFVIESVREEGEAYEVTALMPNRQEGLSRPTQQ